MAYMYKVPCEQFFGCGEEGEQVETINDRRQWTEWSVTERGAVLNLMLLNAEASSRTCQVSVQRRPATMSGELATVAQRPATTGHSTFRDHHTSAITDHARTIATRLQ